MSKPDAPETLPALAGQHLPVSADAFEKHLQQVERIRKLVLKLLKKGQDFGTVPGITRPFLFQPGASKICIGMNVYPEYELERVSDLPYRVKARCKLYGKGSGILLYTGPWRGAAAEERTFAARVNRRGLIGELIAELAQVQEKGWAAWLKDLDRRSMYGQKYAPLKKPVVYPLMKQPTLAAAIEYAQAAYDQSETLGAVLEAIDTRAQKRAYVHATRTFAGVEDLFAQDEDLVAEERGAGPAPAPAAAAGGVVAGEGKDGAAQAAKPAPSPKGRQKKPEKPAAPALSPENRGEDLSGPLLANKDQLVAITQLCERLGVLPDAGIKLVGATAPLTRSAAETVIKRLHVRVDQRQHAAGRFAAPRKGASS